MTTISHKNLTTTQLHENKGADAASDDTVATITSHATVWKKLTASNLTGTGNSFGDNLLQIQTTAASGIGGGTATTGAWTKRTLTTAVVNEFSAGLASSVISLAAGTYWVDCQMANFACGHGRIRLQDTTSPVTLVTSLSSYAINSVNHQIPITMRGRFTLAGTKNVELQYYVENASTGGLGEPYAAPAITEIYVDLLIWKII